MSESPLDAFLAALARLESGRTGLQTAMAGLDAGQTRQRGEITALLDRLDIQILQLQTDIAQLRA